MGPLCRRSYLEPPPPIQADQPPQDAPPAMASILTCSRDTIRSDDIMMMISAAGGVWWAGAWLKEFVPGASPYVRAEEEEELMVMGSSWLELWGEFSVSQLGSPTSPSRPRGRGCPLEYPFLPAFWQPSPSTLLLHHAPCLEKGWFHDGLRILIFTSLIGLCLRFPFHRIFFLFSAAYPVEDKLLFLTFPGIDLSVSQNILWYTIQQFKTIESSL